MTILDKYLTREILKHFCMVLTMVIGIYIIVDFFDDLDNIIETGLSFSRALILFVSKIPFVLTQLMPVCVLLAIIIPFGLMNRHNEIIALRSSGMSIYYLLRGVFILGIFFTILLFILSEILVPISTANARKIWRTEVKKKSILTWKKENIWIKGNRSISHINHFHPGKQEIYDVTLSYFDKQFRL
jgi:lipopolysaccharide export system permease protein